MDGTSCVALVVEDEDDIRNLVGVVLERAGFTVHVSATGASALAQIETLDPDLVTVDVGLPDIDGFEVVRRARAFSAAHIVMLTARADEMDAIDALEVSADGYVTKPFRAEELRACVTRIREDVAAEKREQVQVVSGPVVSGPVVSGPVVSGPVWWDGFLGVDADLRGLPVAAGWAV